MQKHTPNLGESGFVHIILAIIILIGVILAVILSFVFGIDRAYQEEFNQSIFSEESGAAKIKAKLREKADELENAASSKDGKLAELKEKMKQKKDQLLSKGTPGPAAGNQPQAAESNTAAAIPK